MTDQNLKIHREAIPKFCILIFDFLTIYAGEAAARSGSANRPWRSLP